MAGMSGNIFRKDESDGNNFASYYSLSLDFNFDSRNVSIAMIPPKDNMTYMIPSFFTRELLNCPT
jgi:hypothetical protein